MKYKRIFLLVLDSLGVGEASDAANYNDIGANTLGHIKEKYNLFIPNLTKLGFLDTINMSENKEVDAYYTIAKPNNKGKDTLNGHYEMMGIKNNVEFNTFYENGFPTDLLKVIEKGTRMKVIGNRAVDSDQIINELGDEQLKEKALIVYTSFDSTLQVAANEKLMSVSTLYRICEAIKKVTTAKKEWNVARVIARPFTGNNGKYKKTNERKDFCVSPPSKSVLDNLKDNNIDVIAIGKINDIFDGQGITKSIKATTNSVAINKLNDIMDKNFTGLCFANLADSDYQGHTRNVEEYAKIIEAIDVEIPMILNKLNTDDLLIITADHGNDPTFEGFNHTRENVPVILFSRNFKKPQRLDALDTLADIGATIADNFEVESPTGTSILDKLI